ncbi:cytosolic protein [Candidatus Woesearchaeota archaeon]|nr:cytosolic protein [Candidatus Woesearchaeota archaeon]
MECKQEQNKEDCSCSYEPCSRKGVCCECISYHLGSRELPACCFPNDTEKSYDRSFEKFAELVNDKKL